MKLTLKDIAPVAIFLLLANIVLSSTMNIPVWDAWHNVRLFDLLFTGKLQFSDLFQDVNGHRLLFPRIIILTLGYFSGYDTRYEILINLLLGFSIFLVFKFYILDNLKLNLLNQVALGAVTAILLFSFVQYENWYFGWEICYFLAIFASLASIAMLSQSTGMHKLFIATLLAIVASFSFANGLLVWPIGLLLLIFRKFHKLIILSWLTISAIVYFLYFHDLHGGLNIELENTVDYVKYFLMYLGAPLSIKNHFISCIWALIGLIIFLVICFFLINTKNLSSLAVTLIAFAFFSMLTGVLISIGRLNFGIEYSLLSRYTSFSIIFWTSVSCLIAYCMPLRSQESEKYFLMSLLLMIGIASLKNSILVRDEFSIHHKRMLYAKNELMKPDFRDANREAIKNITWDVDFTLQQALVLKAYKLSLYKAP